MRESAIILLCCIVGFLNTKAQSASYTLTFDTSIVLIGQQTKATVTLKSPAGAEFILPVYEDSITKPIEILEIAQRDTSYSEDLKQRIESITYTITSFDSGFHVIKPQFAKVNGDTIWSEPALFEVHTVPPKEKELEDIKPIELLESPFMAWLRAYWYYILAGLVLLAALIASFIWYRNRPKETEEEVVSPSPETPYHVTALERLNSLRDNSAWTRGEHKAFHTELSEIVRWYIEKRYAVRALELTTVEIMASLRFANIANEDKEYLSRLLHLSDMVKYAKEEPLASESKQLVDDAIAWVEKTSIDNTADATASDENPTKS